MGKWGIWGHKGGMGFFWGGAWGYGPGAQPGALEPVALSVPAPDAFSFNFRQFKANFQPFRPGSAAGGGVPALDGSSLLPFRAEPPQHQFPFTSLTPQRGLEAHQGRSCPTNPPRDPPQVQPPPPGAWLRPLPNPKRRVGGDPKASGPYRMDEACSPSLSLWEVLRAVTILVTDPKFTLLATNVPCGWHFVPVASS